MTPGEKFEKAMREKFVELIPHAPPDMLEEKSTTLQGMRWARDYSLAEDFHEVDEMLDVLLLIATGLVQGESTAEYAGFSAKEVATKFLKKKMLL